MRLDDKVCLGVSVAFFCIFTLVVGIKDQHRLSAQKRSMQAHYPIRTASSDGGSGGEWHDFVAVEEVLSAAPIGRRVVRVQLRSAYSHTVPSMRQAMAFLEDGGSDPASPGKAFRACLTKSLRGIAERFAPNN